MRSLPGRNWFCRIALPAAAFALSGCAQVETEETIDDPAATSAPEPMAEDMAAEEPAPEGHFEPVEPEEGEPQD